MAILTSNQLHGINHLRSLFPQLGRNLDQMIREVTDPTMTGRVHAWLEIIVRSLNLESGADFWWTVTKSSELFLNDQPWVETFLSLAQVAVRRQEEFDTQVQQMIENSLRDAGSDPRDRFIAFFEWLLKAEFNPPKGGTVPAINSIDRFTTPLYELDDQGFIAHNGFSHSGRFGGFSIEFPSALLRATMHDLAIEMSNRYPGLDQAFHITSIGYVGWFINLLKFSNGDRTVLSRDFAYGLLTASNGDAPIAHSQAEMLVSGQVIVIRVGEYERGRWIGRAGMYVKKMSRIVNLLGYYGGVQIETIK